MTLGIVLDGIPESLVLGLTVLEAGSVSVAFLIAVFIANIPESIAATTAFVSSRAKNRPRSSASGYSLASASGLRP